MANQVKLDIVKLEAAADKLKVMSHPMRIAIIELLHEKEKSNVTQIYKTLKIEQATASHHLNVLKSRGILQSKRNGKEILYSLKEKTLIDILSCIDKCGS